MSPILRIALACTACAALAVTARAENPPHGAGAEAPTPVNGKVLETMNSGGYTYVLVDSGTSKVWAAGYETVVHTGDVITIPAGVTMANFHSDTLQRTFDSIRFVASFSGDDEGAADDAGTGMGMGQHGAAAGTNPHKQGLPQGHPSVAPVDDAIAAKAEPVEPPAGGMRIKDVHAGKADLSGKEVTVKGRVVKVTRNVMGRTWIHLQDGSAPASAGGDLTVTTDGSASIGDVVTAKGTIATDQDFGYGYTYDVLLEKAAISK